MSKKTDEEKDQRKLEVRQIIENELIPIWRGQQQRMEYAITWIVTKTGYSSEIFRSEVIPWLKEWNRQTDMADRSGKREFYAPLPNLYTFVSEKRWKDKLPFDSFAELTSDDKIQTSCSCGKKAIIKIGPEWFCSWHYSHQFCNTGPTGLDKLRHAWKTRIPHKPNESGLEYIARVYGGGKKQSLGEDKTEITRSGGVSDYGPEDAWAYGGEDLV